MAEEKTLFKFSESELELIKKTFNGNDELLKTIKKAMLQIELTEQEDTARMKIFKGNSELIRVLRKFFIPTLNDKNTDIHSMSDLWVSFNKEINFRDRRIEDALPLLNGVDIVLKYLDQQIRYVCGNNKVENKIDFNKLTEIKCGKATKENYINIFARDMIFRRVENVIMAIWSTAQVKEETAEEMAKRFKANSNK